MTAKKSYLLVSRTLYTIFIILVGVYIGHYYPELLGISNNTNSTNNTVLDGDVGGTDTSSDLDQAKIHGVDMDVFWKVWDLAEEYHVDSGQDPEKLINGAINGMLEYGYDDIFSWYLEPSENEIVSDDLSGSFYGVGIELELIAGELQIIAPLQGTPGEEAGLLAGDVITHVDGVDIADDTILESVALIRGKKGSKVVLTIKRYTETGLETLDIPVVRDEIDVASVKYEMLEEGIYLVSIRNFAGDTAKEWDEVISDLSDKGLKGIVLDLRNNSGGYVSAALHIISDFVPEGTAIMEDYGDGDVSTIAVSGNGNLYDIPVAILTNYGTASASEMLAGALQDYEIAKLIGTQSFGKGVIQQLFDIDVSGEENPGNVRIVVSKWYTPKERWIQHTGLTPDVEVIYTREDFDNGEDPVLDAGLTTIKEMISL